MKMSDRSFQLFMLEQNIMTMKKIICEADEIVIDQELKLVIYRAVKPILIRRIKERLKDAESIKPDNGEEQTDLLKGDMTIEPQKEVKKATKVARIENP